MARRDYLAALIGRITVPYGWRFELWGVEAANYIRVVCDYDRCNVTGNVTSWNGRPWYISNFACDSEIVQTCLKAVLTAVEHETREKFLLDGRMIFGPHVDVAALLEIADRVEKRKEIAA